MKNQGKIVVARDRRNEWYFKLVAENGKILMKSESYKNKQGLANAIKAVYDLLNQNEVLIETVNGTFIKNIVKEKEEKKLNFCDRLKKFFKFTA